MALETRKPGGPKYVYQSRRDPETGKVRKVYFGRGPKAAAAAAELEARRRQRMAERQAIERAGGELRSAEGLMAALNEGIALVMEASLMATNWHRRNYGPWRQRRTGNDHGRHRTAPTGRPDG